MTDHETDSDALLTQKDVAALLRISPATVNMLRHKGKLPYVQIGSRVLYRRASVLAFVEASEISK